MLRPGRGVVVLRLMDGWCGTSAAVGTGLDIDVGEASAAGVWGADVEPDEAVAFSGTTGLGWGPVCGAPPPSPLFLLPPLPLGEVSPDDMVSTALFAKVETQEERAKWKKSKETCSGSPKY